MMSTSTIKQPNWHLLLFFAQTSNTFVYLTQSSLLRPTILDFGASVYISNNKDLLSSLITTSILPIVTLANNSQTTAKGIGLAHPLPSLPLTSILYTPKCRFNLISHMKLTSSLNYLIIFSVKFVILQDQGTRTTICIGREYQGLYHHNSPSSLTACLSIDATLLVYIHTGHPNLSKFQKIVSCYSTLSSLKCELW